MNQFIKISFLIPLFLLSCVSNKNKKLGVRQPLQEAPLPELDLSKDPKISSFKIEKAGLEVSKVDNWMLPMTKDEALEYCKKIGWGWRLPTSNEMYKIWSYSETIKIDDTRMPYICSNILTEKCTNRGCNDYAVRTYTFIDSDLEDAGIDTDVQAIIESRCSDTRCNVLIVRELNWVEDYNASVRNNNNNITKKTPNKK